MAQSAGSSCWLKLLAQSAGSSCWLKLLAQAAGSTAQAPGDRPHVNTDVNPEA
ncbi:hypothetical protein HPC62_14400 [Thermoleptolyngbya sichuanensis A183]|uniref:Uncharacterized protein n=1 Tax=Thermoleptolyngbya sichuanensis A183 TaxID=2737172 RepID=A0A6M8BLS5_9CYAN|nr:hypothetical protein [Thermoleptolyngbya sp. PKUAC-SCTB121]QKD83225.1 hypothetical protein HPC62_14400 [Thermoleptolyngbya sichuanensis A183]